MQDVDARILLDGKHEPLVRCDVHRSEPIHGQLRHYPLSPLLRTPHHTK
jgi:hypothetical protein